MTGRTLTVLGAQGDMLWTYRFDRPVQPLDPERWNHRIRLVDWNGDGRLSVAVAALHPVPGVAEGRGDEVLYSFSRSGRLVWQHDLRPALKDAWGRPFDPAWEVTDTAATGSPGHAAHLYVSLAHTLRWPGAVLRFDSQGNSTIPFVHPGNVQRVLSLNSPFGPSLLIAGVNNARNRTFVALLGEADPPSAPPPEVQHYQYSSAPLGRVRVYFLLPPSEYNLLHEAPYSHVYELSTSFRKVFITLYLGAANGVHYTYAFDSDLRPVEVLHRGSEPFLHRQMEDRGLVRHTYADCPERVNPALLKRWTPDGGWEDVLVPGDDPRFDPPS